jgi:hypothetical protein
MNNSFGSPSPSICMNLWTALNSDSDTLNRDNLSVNSSQRIFTSLLSEQILKKRNQSEMDAKRLLENLEMNCDQQRSLLLDFDKDISTQLGKRNTQISELKDNEKIFNKNVRIMQYWEKDGSGKI